MIKTFIKPFDYVFTEFIIAATREPIAKFAPLITSATRLFLETRANHVQLTTAIPSVPSDSVCPISANVRKTSGDNTVTSAMSSLSIYPRTSGLLHQDKSQLVFN